MVSFIEEHLQTPLGELTPIIQKGIGQSSSYFGVRTLKNPMDAWVYQEIVFEQRPDVIVEIGNAWGGSALYLAHLCDLLGHGRVIAVDVDQRILADVARTHPRIRCIEGDASDCFELVRGLVGDGQRTLVIEDSAHTFDNTLMLLRLYSQLVLPGGYLIVEDSICHHGLEAGPNPGPWEAIETFLAEDTRFESDRSREHFLITWNPKGYLRRLELSPDAPSAPDPLTRDVSTSHLRCWLRRQLHRGLLWAVKRLTPA